MVIINGEYRDKSMQFSHSDPQCSVKCRHTNSWETRRTASWNRNTQNDDNDSNNEI